MEIDPMDTFPCAWCLDAASPTSCMCIDYCGETTCGKLERPEGERQPLPQFIDVVKQTVALGETAPPKPTAPVVLKKDAPAAVARVLALHSQCDCKVCVEGARRPGCCGCSELWPCPTVLTALS